MENIIESIERQIFEGDLSQKEQVQLFELLCKYLNLQTLSDYAKSEKITYNGAKKRKLKTVRISNITLIINNE